MGSSNRNRLWAFAVIVILMNPGCGSKKPEAGNTAVRNDSSPLIVREDPAPESYNKETDLGTYIVHRNVDTGEVFVVDSTCIVELPPTEEEHVQAIKDSAEEDFTTAADDYSFYASALNERADSLHVRVVQATKRYLRFIVNDTLSVLVDTRVSGSRSWSPFLFRKGRLPEIVGMVDAPDTRRLESYFRPSR